MKTEDTSKTAEDAVKGEKPEGSPGFPGMCHQMMAGGLPPCCKMPIKEMMAQWMARMKANEGK